MKIQDVPHREQNMLSLEIPSGECCTRSHLVLGFVVFPLSSSKCSDFYRCTVHFAESLDGHTNQYTHLNCLH